MKRFNQMGIRRQLELTSVLPLILFGFLASVVSIYSLQQVARQLILQRNKALVQVAAASVESDLLRYVRPLEVTAETITSSNPNSTIQDETILRQNESFLNAFQGGVALLDRRGYAYANTTGHDDRRGIDYSFRDYFKTVQATHRSTFSAVLKEQPSGKDAVVVATPLIRKGEFDGALIGVLFLNQTSWSQIMAPLHTEQGGQAYLIDDHGMVIYRPQGDASISTNIQNVPYLWSMAKTGETSSQMVSLENNRDAAIVSFAVIQSAGWGLFMEEPWKAILAPAIPYQWLVVSLLGVGTVIFLIVLSISLNRITHPMLAVEQQVSSMARGSFPHPIDEQGPSEVRSLISVFNHMVVRIKEQQAALQRYALQILNTQEEERKRISRELHDETVQEIVGLAQRIDLGRNEMVRDPAAARRRLDEVYELAQRTLVDVRRMSHDLKPFVLEDLGLTAAIQVCSDELMDALPATEIHCHVLGEEYRLSTEVELTIYRIAQEAMTNIRKHARTATQVNVQLEYDPQYVRLTVEDNGPGFDCSNLRELSLKGHLGLEGMQERALLFGAKFSIQTECNHGTRIVLFMPTQRSGTTPSDG